MCAAAGPADAQTEEGEQVEESPQAGPQYRAQTTVSHSALSPICRRSARPWFTRLPGVSNRPGGSVETTRGSRLGPRSDHHSGRVLSVHQDLRLETGVYLRYQWTFLVPQFRRAVGL